MAKINKKLKRGRVYLKKSNKVPDPVAVSLQQNILNQARVAHQAGYLSQAEALYCQVLSTEPNSPDALHYLGMLAHQTGRSAMAVELIGKAIRGRSDYVNAYKNLGLILWANWMRLQQVSTGQSA